MDLELTLTRVRAWWRRTWSRAQRGGRRAGLDATALVRDPRARLDAAVRAERLAPALRELRLGEPGLGVRRVAARCSAADVAQLLAARPDAVAGAGTPVVSQLGIGLRWGRPSVVVRSMRTSSRATT
jgi:hypothetical protein